MNRRSFFKFLGIGAATAAVAPKMLADTSDPVYAGPHLIRGKWLPSLEGKLTIFNNPRKEGYDYSIGVETGNGIDTPSVFSVMRMGTGDEPCVQVAEYTSHNPTPAQFAHDIAKVAKFYGSVCIDPRGPMLVIEQISDPGDTIQAMMKIMGFTRFFKAVNSNGIKRDGWYTTRFSGPIMMDRFVEAVRLGWYKPQSIQLGGDLTVAGGTKYPTAWVRAAAQSYVGYHSFDEDKRNA